MAKKKKKKKSNVVLNIIIALVFLAGAGVFLYPTISDMWNQYRNAQLVSKYEEAVTELSDNDYDRLWKEAKEYNAEHPVNAIVDAFEEEDTYELSHPYDRVLDPNGDGLMGSIEIPKIKARLAIYHGLSKTVLEKGVGHVTLITCTPYGVNTHRLLVRGVRTKYVVEDTKNDETIPQKLAVVDPKRVLAGGAAVLVVLILLIYLIVRHRDKKRKKKQLSERKEEAESDEK